MDTGARLALRLPADLKEWLRQRAEANYRSLNAEIVAILAAEKQREVEKKMQ
ncbi:Arc family DNA-binding protein [Noviherbaspirillum pedocola]|uniref:Arc family DNA-binding protein n=1 Tax=Noviherbaspirillum pedocola TaxID=2801341 RepID=A0A934T1P9_9BURK|nr:Arc family DNA-binding protein [Noviherbaspirillum pedocola]MBK4739221.1 Arc family DNA-binding protein [Noviherbaspirillum pedocola]